MMKTKITVKTELDVILPHTPNFIRTPNKDVVIEIHKLTRDQIKQIGEQWSAAFLEKWEERKRKHTATTNQKLNKLYGCK